MKKFVSTLLSSVVLSSLPVMGAASESSEAAAKTVMIGGLEVPCFNEGGKAIKWRLKMGSSITPEVKDQLRAHLSKIAVDFDKLISKGINVLDPAYNDIFTNISFRAFMKRGPKFIDQVCQLIEHNWIKTLNLNANNIDDADAKKISEMLAKSTSLESLSLGSNVIDTAGMCALADSLKSNTTLKSLALSFNKSEVKYDKPPYKMNPIAVDVLVDMLSVNTSLETLAINQIGVQGSAIIGEALGKNSIHLKHLDLSCQRNFSEIGDAGVNHIAAGLKTNTTLKSIDLTGNEIGARGAQYLADALRANETLENLSLGCNDIGDSGFIAIIDALEEKNRTLRSVSLHGKIGESAAWKLASMIKKNPVIEKIYAQMMFSDRSAIGIADAVEGNPNIKYICMGVKSDKTKEAIRKQLGTRVGM